MFPRRRTIIVATLATLLLGAGAVSQNGEGFRHEHDDRPLAPYDGHDHFGPGPHDLHTRSQPGPPVGYFDHNHPGVRWRPLPPPPSKYPGGNLFCKPVPGDKEWGDYGDHVIGCKWPPDDKDPNDPRRNCVKNCLVACGDCAHQTSKTVGCLSTTIEDKTVINRCFCGGQIGAPTKPGCPS